MSLERFKSQISLTDFAIDYGYTLDTKSSTQTHFVLYNQETKIIVSLSPSGHWQYFNAHDDNDKGTVIDFVQNRNHVSLGHVRKILRAYDGSSNEYNKPLKVKDSSLSQKAYNREGILNVLENEVAVVEYHSYLIERGIPKDIQLRYPNTIGVSKGYYKNVVFPHQDFSGFCGGELKNKGFTGFMKGGKRSIWLAKTKNPTVVAVGESAIDCLSFAAMYPHNKMNLISLSGVLSTHQEEVLHKAVGSLPVHICTDADPAGDKIASKLAELFQSHLRCRPPLYKDWNYELLSTQVARVKR